MKFAKRNNKLKNERKPVERFKLRAEACSSLQASVNFTNVPFLHTQRESTWTHAHLQYSRCWMNPISHASTTATAAKPKPPIIYHWPITIRQSMWTRQPRPIRERFTRQNIRTIIAPAFFTVLSVRALTKVCRNVGGNIIKLTGLKGKRCLGRWIWKASVESWRG